MFVNLSHPAGLMDEDKDPSTKRAKQEESGSRTEVYSSAIQLARGFGGLSVESGKSDCQSKVGSILDVFLTVEI